MGGSGSGLGRGERQRERPSTLTRFISVLSFFWDGDEEVKRREVSTCVFIIDYLALRCVVSTACVRPRVFGYAK